MESDLLEWFAAEGLVRYSVSAGEDGEYIERAHPPLVALGPRDEDFVLPPHPDILRYAGKRLHEMRLQDYNEFLFRWFEAALQRGADALGLPVRRDRRRPQPASPGSG